MSATRRNRIQSMLDDEVFEAVVEAAQGNGQTISDYVLSVLKKELGL